MTTSSSERGRCTRISPSAILDDRLEGKDLEWALDHLKGCDVCRDRIEEFRDIVVRVERLPIAPIAPAIVRDAYTWAIPEGLRTDPDLTSGRLDSIRPSADPGQEPIRIELPQWEMPVREEMPPPAPSRGLVDEETRPPLPEPSPAFPLEESLATPVHEVAFDSRRQAATPVAEEPPTDQEPISTDPRHEARVTTMTRVAVGLVAAVCVLLAGLLYADGGLLTAFRSAPSHAPLPSVRNSTTASPAPSPSPSASATPTANVVASLGDGATGERVWRVRLGTLDPAFTRLVFDMQGPGLPTMTVSQPDTGHLVVTFKDATGPGLSTGGVHTMRVARLEPPVQQGSDLVITIDLARPVQPKVFTLTGPARLVLDLY